MSEISIAGIPRAATITGQISVSHAATVKGRINSPAQVQGTVGDGVYISGNVPYELPPATTDTLGGVIVGDDLLVTQEGRISVDKTDSFSADNTKPVTAAAVYTEIGNINALLATI